MTKTAMKSVKTDIKPVGATKGGHKADCIRDAALKPLR